MAFSLAKSINKRFIFWLAIINASTLFVFFLAFISYDASSVEVALNEEADQILTFSKKSLASAMWQYNHDYVEDHAESLFLYEDVVFTQHTIENQIIKTKIRDGYKHLDFNKDLNSKKFIVRSSPIEYNNEKVGSIIFVMNKERISGVVLRDYVAAGLLLLFVSGITTMTTIVLFRKNVMTPLVSLDSKAKKIAKGALDTPIDTSSEDEIGQLAKTFSLMMQNIRTIKGSKDDLDAEISVRKLAEKKLNDVLQFNKKIISTSPVGITIYEADSGQCIAANESIAVLIGGTEEEMLKQNFYHIESWQKSGLLAVAQETIKEKTSKRKTIQIQSTFGKYVAIDCFFSQFSFSDKQHLLLATTDVTQKLEDEKTIIRQRQKAERYLNLAGIMFIGLNDQGCINVANKKACQVLEVEQEIVLGQNWFDNYIPQDSRDDVFSVFRQIIEGDFEPVEYYENSIVSSSGTEKHIAWHNTAIRNEDGVIVGLLSSGEDITEKKHLRAKLQQAQKMEAIGTLAGGIAHDFNNILSSILGFCELARNGVEKGSVVESDLQEVLTAGIRARDLVQQILTFARQSDEVVQPVQVGSIVKEVLKFLKSSMPANINIKSKIESDSFAIGSPTQIHQIIMNLCTNASQSMEANGGDLEVSVEDVTVTKPTKTLDLTAGEYVIMSVKDSGSGIASKDIATIFEPYFTTKMAGDGTGMGLAVVHGIVEKYHGKIVVESQLNKGSTFSVYLPITESEKEQTSFEETSLPSGNEHILIVDDEVAVAKMERRILEQLGYTVTVRTNSVEALELFKTSSDEFDLVLTDMTMPYMTGDKLTIELMKIKPDIPVVLCTGYSKNISEEEALDIGFKSFAYKPIIKADLAKIVRNVLDGVAGATDNTDVDVV